MDNHGIREFATAIRMAIAGRLFQAGVVHTPAVALIDRSRGLPEHSSSGWNAIRKTPGLTSFAGLSSSADPEEVVRVISASELHGPVRGFIPIAGIGVFGFAEDKAGIDRMVEGAVHASTTGLPPLSKRNGRLTGRVVVVTGSAQGFGRGIAEELAGEGASVVVTDINDPVGQAFAAELNSRHGAGTAMYGHMNVADAESIRLLVDQVVSEYGGLDIFVSNAGVLKAGSLEEMDEKGFDLVTNVNYKAFFLCAREVSRVMKLQHRFFPGHMMDIIQINSKSGLAGSNKNFAYAGSKFGGIGLTQSFALELVDHNIKVNAICPGNYYEGPLWSDPETGLFVQYLRAGKVPGAASIDDVKMFYMSKVPMKRGCSPRDVARAIFYLHEQEYETGQALPVTGGQVMLN